MAYANNRGARRPRASFNTAGGVVMKFRHPMLAYQIDEASPVDEIDISRCVKLNDTFFNATPAQDSAFQEVLVDGSTITVTNHLMAGTITLPVVRTSGFVGLGDFVAACHLIVASKDSEGGVLTVIQNINGRRIITIYYGVSIKNAPHQIIAGNAVVTYPVVLNYAGWVQANSNNEDTSKVIWAVGNKFGIKATYKPFGIQNGEGSGDFYGGTPITADTGGVTQGMGDSADNDVEHLASIDSSYIDGVVEDTPETHEDWGVVEDTHED